MFPLFTYECGFFCSVARFYLTLLQPYGLLPARFFLSIGFPRQEYWSRLSFPSPGHLPNLETEPEPPALGSRFFTAEPPRKTTYECTV